MKNRKKSRVTNCKKSYQIEEPPDEFDSSHFFSKTLLVFICIFVGFLNYYHASTMQENNVMFSHLSNMERELSFRTEMGFYYSFYKQVINAPSLYTMINLLVRDNLTEYPDTINALQRFNVYPELVLGVLYKWFVAVAPHFGISLKTCYMVNRGDLSAVESCEGLGEPAIFYVAMVMLLNGAMMSCLFLLGRTLSNGSMFGGFLTCACYLFNHRECTRVQWTPPLRESFSFPCLIAQQLFLTIILKKPRYSQVSLVVKLGFCASTLMALLSWQFAQFALLTQCVALFLAYVVASGGGSGATGTDGSASGDERADSADSTRHAVRSLLILLILADLANLLLQFGNTLLLTGPLRPCLIMALLIVTLEPRSVRMKFRNSVLAPLRWVTLLVCLVLSTVVLKFFIGLLLRINSDDHMFDILRSKFSNFSSFDSLLYTCAPEFDFYDVSSLPELCKTGLLPLAGFVVLVIVSHTCVRWLKCFCSSRGDRDCSENIFAPSEFIDIADFYLVFQTLAYVVMAAMIMRLKLFATPQLCIIVALVAKRNWPLNRLGEYVSTRLLGARGDLWRSWSMVLVLALCAIRGVQNLRGEWEIQGSYTNWDQEQLMGFITTNTDQQDAFTGQMATMATVRLVTSRPIIIHPHYEDEALRDRVHTAYSVYSRRPIREVWLALRSTLQAKYLVYEHMHCQSRPRKPGCSYLEMWDLKDPGNANRTALCGVFDDYVRILLSGQHQFSPATVALQKYFRWRFTSDGGSYSLFEILDVPT